MTENMENVFDSREAASAAAAAHIGEALARRLEAQGKASVVVSGGSSPAGVFAELAQTALAWSDVHVIMSDERWVPPDHADSNERLVRETLLTGAAQDAKLLPFYAADTAIEARCEELDEELRLAPFPFACALLGMGEDGHFASLFPDADNLAEGLDVDSSRLCIPVNTAASEHARLSLSLSALSRSDEILLLIFGEQKREIYETAKQDANGFPVSHLLRQKRAPVHLYWAP